jgi:iron complex outermembrane receptor protein
MNRTHVSGVATAVAAVLHAAPLYADQADEPGALQEIVVTATRRSQSVNDVPYNITALSGDTLNGLGMSDLNSVVRSVPGLANFDDGARGSGLRNTYSLRGLNADAASNQDDNPRLNQPTVSTYLGDTPFFFPLKLVDLDRVEVLRGPQGTLYGSGSIGGTVRFIPKKAEFNRLSVETSLEGSHTDHGSDLGYDSRITGNIPIGTTAAFRGTLGYERTAGFIDALGLVQQTGTPRQPGAVVLADPSAPLTSPAASAAPRLNSNDAHILYAQGQLRIAPASTVDITVEYHHQDTYANDRSQDNPFYGNHREYVRYAELTSPEDARFDLASVEAQVDLGFASLVSNTAYSDARARSVSGDASGFLQENLAQLYLGFPRLIAPETRTETHGTVTQEVRLVSSGTHRIDWVVGGFYLRDRLSFNYLQSMPGISAFTNAVLSTPTPVDFTDVLAGGGTHQTFQDIALFGEPTWHVTDKWQVTGGARIFHQTLRGESGVALPYASRTFEYFTNGSADNDYLLGGPVPTRNTTNDHVFKLNTSYRVSAAALLYATWAEGFRAGGANALPVTDQLGNDNRPILQFRPDQARSYEIGLKGDWQHRLQFNATAFYVDWKDFQTTLVSPLGVSYIGNVALARSRGIELAANGYLTSALAFNLGYSYTQATVEEPFRVVPADPTTVIEPGTTLPNAPRHSAFANLAYTQHFGKSLLTYATDVSYRSSANSFFRSIPSLASDNFQRLGGFAVWGASISWERGPYQVMMFGRNLGNARGTTIVSTAKLLGEKDQGQGVITPRTLGLRLLYSFE